VHSAIKNMNLDWSVVVILIKIYKLGFNLRYYRLST
jgi:hypothetical protein